MPGRQADVLVEGDDGAVRVGLAPYTSADDVARLLTALALREGLTDLVKASITGSILGNLLLVLGLAQLAGGIRYKVQRFNINLAGLSISLLVVAVIGLVIPALFHATHVDPTRELTRRVSVGVAGMLIVGYVSKSLHYIPDPFAQPLPDPSDAVLSACPSAPRPAACAPEDGGAHGNQQRAVKGPFALRDHEAVSGPRDQPKPLQDPKHTQEDEEQPCRPEHQHGRSATQRWPSGT